MTNTQKARDLVKTMNGEFKAADVTKKLGLSSVTSGYIFLQLIKEGLIKKVRHGHYLDESGKKKAGGKYFIYKTINNMPRHKIDMTDPMNKFLTCRL